MLDTLLQEMRNKVNELHKLKQDAENAAVRVNPPYSVSEMKSALLAMQFTIAAIEEAKKKSAAAPR